MVSPAPVTMAEATQRGYAMPSQPHIAPYPPHQMEDRERYTGKEVASIRAVARRARLHLLG